MNDRLFLHSNTIPLPDAKKLLAAIQKPAKNGSWQDWSGEGGFITEVKLGPVCGPDVGRIDLPGFVVGLLVSVDESKIPSSDEIPDSMFLGGNDWVIPDYDCTSLIRFEIVEPELAYPMWYSYQKITNMRFFGRDYNSCNKLIVGPCFKAQDHILPDRETVDSVIEKLKIRFDIPKMTDKGFLEASSRSKGGFDYNFDPERNTWLSENFRDMVEKQVEGAAPDRFSIVAHVNIGGVARFHGEQRNVREEAQELLRRISEKGGYSSYDVTYYWVGPQDWKDREKSRKKWTTTIHQELGTLTLEDGTYATVKLRIEKEGYVFTLDFEDVDALATFRGTKLFQKTHWNLGAE